MSKESKLIKGLKIAKAQGSVYVASVVKSKFATTYYNVQKIDDVLVAGKWIPAERNNGAYHNWYGRMGTSHLPENTISRQEVFSLAESH